ncbi:hypothetical protein DFH09DRAFT_919459 [Mycena vulgaris]|nr:hypothetical protein DFH09DRAFT_919459 [Mycena vulgaris]
MTHSRTRASSGIPKDAFNARGRGSYAAQACSVCRSKKIKCDGVKPVCGPCGATGRNGECSWGRNVPVRKPRTEAHFESLRKRADALQAYAERLEGLLTKCVCQDVSAHALARPEPAGEYSGREASESDADSTLESDDEITQELCVDTQALKANDISGGLLHHGITAPMRFSTKSTKERLPIPDDVENPDASYVLLVDGVDAVGYDPDFDWSRHLPPEVPLKRREHDKILDLAFKFFTFFCLRLIPSLFLRDMHRALSVPRTSRPPRTPYYSPMLHNAILASSAVFSDDPRIRDINSRRYFAAAAKRCLEEECKRPNLCLVHALGMIGTFHGTAGDHILADLYFGMGARISQALGLEVDSSAWVKSGLIKQDELLGRNWAHWTIFSLDLCWTLYFGKDFCGPPVDRPAIPLPFVDAELDQTPWYHAPANIPPQPNYLSRTFSTSTSLLLIGRRIVDVCVFFSLLSCAFSHLDPSSLELNNWKGQLPPELDITFSNRAKSTPQRLMLHCTYWWCFIILHRPFFNRRARPVQSSDRAVDHVKLCKRAAENIMELLETWSSLYTLRYSPPTMLQVVFSSGTVFLLLALQATSSLRLAQASLKSALAQAELCIQYLSESGVTWGAAARTGDILRNLLDDRLKPILARRFSHELLLGPEIASDSPGPHPARTRGSERENAQSIPLPSDGVSVWNHPQIPYIQAQADHIRGEAGRFQMDFDFADEPELEAEILDAHRPARPSSFAHTFNRGADGKPFPDLDMPEFFLPDLDSIGSSEVWEEGVWGVRRGDLGTGYA